MPNSLDHMSDHRIMYVCSACSDEYPENCGHYDRSELRVMPDGRWLCAECYDEENYQTKIGIPFASLPIPPEYEPVRVP
jgi:hypothetical protein